MMDRATKAVDLAIRAGADYADARVVRLSTQELVVRNGELAVADVREDYGVGLRVLRGGSWGFTAAPAGAAITDSGLEGLARRAVRAAKQLGAAQREPVQLVGEPEHVAEFRTPVEVDAFTVPLGDKVASLQAAEASMEGADEVVVREAFCDLRREEQWQSSSEGARIHQVLARTGAGIAATAAKGGQVERRSWPAAGGNFLAGGWERVLEMDLAAHGARVRDEAVALCSADPCPEGERDLILTGSQLMLQIHESVGHPTELDRVFGHEVDLAGDSFATPDAMRSFRYGSEHVNLVCDSTLAGGLDTRGFDDDGVESGAWHLVKDGLFEGYQTDRQWAARIGEARSRGNSRAEGWYNPPIIRITNLSLQPGSWTLEDLIADTEDGVLCDTVKMWSIDQHRLNFQFTTEIGWEIKNGKRGRMLREPTYQGVTPEFWRSCDAICDASHWQLYGVPNCGKGNPMQVAEMSHGAAPARFRGVTFVR